MLTLEDAEDPDEPARSGLAVPAEETGDGSTPRLLGLLLEGSSVDVATFMRLANPFEPIAWTPAGLPRTLPSTGGRCIEPPPVGLAAADFIITLRPLGPIEPPFESGEEDDKVVDEI